MHIRPLPPITLVALFLALSFLYFPIALVFSGVDTFWSARLASGTGYALLDAAVCLSLCLFIAFAVLVLPMAFAGYLQPENSWLRMVFVVILWSLPALGFGYFVGEFRHSMQAYDYFAGIEVPVIAAALLYWRTQKVLETGLLAGCGLFLGIFLIGDVLGPFPSFVYYAAQGEWVYGLRTTLSALALAVCALLPARPWSESIHFPLGSQTVHHSRKSSGFT